MPALPPPRDQLRAVAAVRTAVGAFAFVFPRRFGRTWIGGDADRGATQVMIRAFGVRDLALGVGALLAVRKGAPARGWVEAGLLSDAGDLLATLVAGRSIPAVGRSITMLAAAGALAEGARIAPVVDADLE